MKERDIRPKTRRVHKRSRWTMIFRRAFVFSFAVAGIWVLGGIIFPDVGGASSTGTDYPLYETCGTADSGQKSADIPQVVSGCGPTCLSIMISGLTGQSTITPYVVAQYANEQGYYVPGAETRWTLMSEGATHFSFAVCGPYCALPESAEIKAATYPDTYFNFRIV